MSLLGTTASTTNSVWFLVGPLDSPETIRHMPIYKVPFMIGRREDLPLVLSCKTVSGVHAEISEAAGAMVLRDMGSTNGTYVNGELIQGPVTLHENDLVQFANIAFRVCQQAGHTETQTTVQEGVYDRAMALVQFDKLMSDRAVMPYFQPIVSLPSREVFGYEVLARSRLFGLETPKDMFRVAAQLDLEVELSVLLRCEEVACGQTYLAGQHLFLNTHPRELVKPGLIASLEALRTQNPEQRMTLEIHESAVADPGQMNQIRAALQKLNIGLAYDDFGAGQSRVNELVECRPDYLKFDMSLIRSIDASPQRQQLLHALVQMAHNLGVIALAEGVETEAESQVCQELGFELGQGYLYGRPAPARNFAP